MQAKKLDHNSMSDRLDLFQITPAMSGQLRQIKPLIDRIIDPALEQYLNLIKSRPELRRLFRDEAHIESIRASVARHWKTLAAAEFDAEFEAERRRVGQAHARVGLDPVWYIGGYARILQSLIAKLADGRRGPAAALLRGTGFSADLCPQISALVTVAMLDLELSLSIYLEQLEHERRKAQAEREDAWERMAVAFECLANRDLNVTVDAEAFLGNERLASAFNQAVANMRDLISECRDSAGGIRSASKEIAEATEDLSRRTEQQAASLEQTTASVVSLSETVQESAGSAKQTDATVGRALADAKAGGEVVRETQTAMTQIEASAREMSQIISVIDEIAFQTNLLALNAGVEAARAGDAGKGFAVVASEVRTLAQRSAEAAKSIKSLIGSSGEHVSIGVERVKNTADVLTRTIAAFGEVSRQVNMMAAATETQANSIAEISTAVRYLDQMTQQNAAMVEQSSAAAASLATEADTMSNLLGRFSVAQ